MKARILIIDDSPTVVGTVCEALEADGYEISTLDCFLDLPRLLDKTPPDLILLDLEMPAFSGENFAAFLRRRRSRVPVVVHSARPREEIEAVARRIGAVAAFEKGRPTAELRRLVASVVRRARAERDA